MALLVVYSAVSFISDLIGQLPIETSTTATHF
jgi:hypothetical protein